MKNNYIYIGLTLAVMAVIAFFLFRGKGSLKKGVVSPDRKKNLAEQYRAQLDGIFTRAAQEMRKLTSAEQMEVNKLQEKLIQLGFVYELPAGYANSDHVFTPALTRIQTYLN